MKSSAAAVLLGLGFAFAAEAAALDFSAAGFRIDELKAPAPAASVSTLIMCLPPSEGFAPNVNVQIQPFPESIDQYVSLSKSQFEQMKWRVISEEKTGANAWRVEYADPSAGKELHYYARAISKGKQIFLATATAKEGQWAGVESALKKCVDSLTLK